MRFAITWLLVLLAGPLFANPLMVVSDWPLSMPTADSTGAYRLITGGHLYGAHANSNSIYPAASFLAHLDEIKDPGADAFIALGDIVRGKGGMEEVHAFENVVAQLDMPFLNASGNHDLANQCLAPSFLRPRHHAFFIVSDLVLILNTECLLEGAEDDLGPFLDRVSEAVEGKSVRNLFVFSHRNVPAAAVSSLSGMDALANEAFIPKVDGKRAKTAFEKVEGIPRKGEWWWFVGDVGVHWSVPLLFGKDEGTGLKVLGVGIGDTEKDALAEVVVGASGAVEVNALPLGTETFDEIEKYTVEYWAEAAPGTESEPGWSEKISLLLAKKSFWAGFLAAFAMLLAFFVTQRLFFRKNK